MGRPGIMLYFDMLDPIRVLTDTERGKLLTAMLEYGKEGTLPNFRGRLALTWGFVQPKIQRDGERYDSVIAKRKYAGYCSHLTRNHMDPIGYEAWLELEEEKNRKDIRHMQQTAYADTCQPTATITPITNIISNSSSSISSSGPPEPAPPLPEDKETANRKKLKEIYRSLKRGTVAMTEQQMDDLMEKMGPGKFEHYLTRLADSGRQSSSSVRKDYTQMIKWMTEDMVW